MSLADCQRRLFEAAAGAGADDGAGVRDSGVKNLRAGGATGERSVRAGAAEGVRTGAAGGAEAGEGPDLDWLVESPGAGPAERLETYRELVATAHAEALRKAYPVTCRRLGEEGWASLLGWAGGELLTGERDLNRYGAFLPGLLAGWAGLAGRGWLVALAELEWRLQCARLAADDPAFDWEGFLALPEAERGRARLLPSAALSVVAADYPVHRLIEDPEAAAPAPRPCVLCVHREGRFGVRVTELDPPAGEILTRVMEGQPLDDLAAGAEDGEAVSRLLFDWIRQGWLAGYAGDR